MKVKFVIYFKIKLLTNKNIKYKKLKSNFM